MKIAMAMVVCFSLAVCLAICVTKDPQYLWAFLFMYIFSALDFGGKDD